MADLKTKINDQDPLAFLESVEDEKKRKDSFAILEMMKTSTGKEPKMWGPAIIGFDKYHYKYDSGREGEWFKVGFSPRKNAISLYFLPNLDQHKQHLEKLGKYKTGKSCLYIKKIEDVDQEVLEKMIGDTMKYFKESKKYD